MGKILANGRDLSSCLLNRMGDCYVTSPTMKLQSRHLLALPAIVLLPASLHAAPGTESLVTIRTTESYSVPGTVLKDENGRPVYPRVPAYENEWDRFDFQGNLIQSNYEYQARGVSTKLSNREFMSFLVSEGVIQNISGWALKAVYNEEDPIPYYYITRFGSDPIYVGDYFSMETYVEATSVNATSMERYNASGQLIASTARDDSTTKSELFMTFATRNPDLPLDTGSVMNIQGIWQHTLSLRPVRVGGALEYRYINGAGSIYNISGSIEDLAPDGEGGTEFYDSVLEGSWSFAPGFAVNNLAVLYPEAQGN